MQANDRGRRAKGLSEFYAAVVGGKALHQGPRRGSSRVAEYSRGPIDRVVFSCSIWHGSDQTRDRRAYPQAVDELVPPMLGVQEVLVLEPRGQWCLLLRRHWHGFRAGTSGLQPERSQLSLKLMGLIDLRRSNNRSIRHCREQLQTPSTRLPWQRASTTAGSPLRARPSSPRR